jgi:inner membrane transporter RhtA
VTHARRRTRLRSRVSRRPSWGTKAAGSIVAESASAPGERGLTDRVPAWSLAVASMLSVQVAAALSTHLFDTIGPAGTAWLRLTIGAIVFIVIRRPRVRSLSRSDAGTVFALGVSTGLVTVAFSSAIDRIPLGTAVAIEFLGPLGVAVFHDLNPRRLVWPALALVGVVLLTQPWHGAIDPVGVLFAVLAGCGWGTYIVLTQRVGDRLAGLRGLSLTIPIAALTAGIVGVPQAAGHLSWTIVAAAAGLAVLMPVLPMSLELLALRRLTTGAFGTLMALEPALGLVAGAVFLSQVPDSLQVCGITLVVAAGIGAERGGHREDRAPDSPPPLIE